ncbi:MAG: pyridoxamine 5'-phosphate oxidase family protein [Elusimicrobia bacterium]|nr:pyridoxamine 5'-phosphate oxidase family protein [Elusimicrobiota bacterium]
MDDLASRGKDLLKAGASGALSTHSAEKPGYPFASLALYALDDAGRPLFLLSGLAVHARNLAADPRASLMVAEGDSQASARVTVLGRAEKLSGAQADAARASYLARHPEAKAWASFGDFALWRLEPEDAYVVAGFGSAGWAGRKAP